MCLLSPRLKAGGFACAVTGFQPTFGEDSADVLLSDKINSLNSTIPRGLAARRSITKFQDFYALQPGSTLFTTGGSGNKNLRIL